MRLGRVKYLPMALLALLVGCDPFHYTKPSLDPVSVVRASATYGQASPSQPLNILLQADASDVAGDKDLTRKLVIERNGTDNDKSITSTKSINTVIQFTGADIAYVHSETTAPDGETSVSQTIEIIVSNIPVQSNSSNPSNPQNPIPPSLPVNNDILAYLQFNDASGNPTTRYHIGDGLTFYLQAQNNTSSPLVIDLSKKNLDYIVYKESTPGQENPNSDTKSLDSKIQEPVQIVLNQDGYFGLRQNPDNSITVTIDNTQLFYNGIDVTSIIPAEGINLSNHKTFIFKTSGEYYVQIAINNYSGSPNGNTSGAFNSSSIPVTE